MSNSADQIFKDKVLGHPAGLFVLFFTEMWERFSYYGMRAILVIFLTGVVTGDNPGWGWSTPAALSLLGTYAMFVYLTPLVGGWLADNKIGYRMAVVIGALLMTLGHAAMAVETPLFLYIGITLLILGNGFFKLVLNRTFANINSKDCQFKAITKNKYDLPMSHQSMNRMPEWKKQVSQWSKELVNASQQFQNGNASVLPAKNACDYCEYDLLCRVDKADNHG